MYPMSRYHGRLPVDDLLALFAAADRRAVVRRLASAERRTDLGSLAEALSTAGTDRDHLRIRLHHQHLPRLDDAGLVAYDPAELTVEYRGDDRAEAFLASPDEFDRTT